MRKLNQKKIVGGEQLSIVSDEIKKCAEELDDINLLSAGEEEIEQMEECLNRLEDDLSAGDKILNEILEIKIQAGKQIETLDFDPDDQRHYYQGQSSF